MTTMTETAVCPKQAALEKLTGIIYQYPESRLDRWSGSLYGNRLLFSESAKVRMASICGFLEGLKHGDPERAATLAYELDRQLTFLAGYGGHSETFTQEGWRPLPQYKVMLHDDGCWGSFSIMWYQIIPVKVIYKMAADKMPQWYKDGSPRPNDVSETDVDIMRWDAQRDAYDHWKVRRDGSKSYVTHDDLMEETRYRPEEYDDQPMYGRAETFVYGFSFNGGLIYHYSKDDLTHGSWSIHT